MRFTETKLPGAFVIELEKREDDRGFFARSFCVNEFTQHGLNPTVAQCNISFNKTRGTMRGMHFQKAPHEEPKLVSCVRGSVYDVIIDLRPDSMTFKQYVGVELSADQGNMLYVPKGMAHGFLTLEDNSTVWYQMGEFYHPESASGVLYNDPAFGIQWPEPVTVISDKDKQYPDYDRNPKF